ncbi:MAG: SH3 domain-containing protein [bacterium]|nr:SH3 domain-containing protein [bacterium]
MLLHEPHGHSAYGLAERAARANVAKMARPTQGTTLPACKEIWWSFMSAFRSFTKTALGLIATAAAVVGWSVVILQDNWLDGLENQLAAVTEGGRSQVSATQTATPKKPLAAGKTELAANKAALTALKAEIATAETELQQLRTALPKQRQAGAPYQTLTRARVRASASTDANEVAVVSAHQMIQVDELVEGGTWYKVRVQGYMFHQLLQPISEE